MSFEPEQFILNVNDELTIDDHCREDNNFKFRGYKIKG